MAQYRLRDAGNGKYVVCRKRFGLFWVDYDDPARPTYLIERDMNRLHKQSERLKEKHEVVVRNFKITTKDLIETGQFKSTGLSLEWKGGFWPPFRAKIVRPPDDWKSMYPKTDKTYDEHLYVGKGDDRFDKKTVFSTTDLGEQDGNVSWERKEQRGNSNNNNQKKGDQNQQRNNRGPDFKLDK